MELRRYLTLLRQRRVLVAITLAVGLLAGWLNTPRSSVYVARSVIYVGSTTIDTSPGSPELNASRADALDRFTKTFAVMIDSTPIAQSAVNATGIGRSADAVVGQTQTVPIVGTQLLNVYVADPDPVMAQRLANALAEVFVEQVKTFEPGRQAGEGSVPSLPAYVFESARLPVVPQSPSLLRNMMLGGAFGLLAAAALVFLLDYLDLSIRSAADAERRLDLIVLGVIPSLEQINPTAGTGSYKRPAPTSTRA